jgi:hypothetical protein
VVAIDPIVHIPRILPVIGIECPFLTVLINPAPGPVHCPEKGTAIGLSFCVTNHWPMISSAVIAPVLYTFWMDEKVLAQFGQG